MSGTNRNRPCMGQMGPLPGTKWDPSLSQTSLSLFNSTVKSPFCPVCPWDGGGSSPGRLSRKGRQKNVHVFYVHWFLLPTKPGYPIIESLLPPSRSHWIFFSYVPFLLPMDGVDVGSMQGTSPAAAPAPAPAAYSIAPSPAQVMVLS